jgi:DNA polymerase-3 subunit epsilon
VFNFGKYLGKPAGKVLYEDKQYYNWMLNKEFTSQVKQIVKQLAKAYEKNLKA